MIIETKKLFMKRGNKVILNNIDFVVNEGDRIAIVGGNGAGKTTLVENILGVQKKTSGEVNFHFKFEKSPLEKIGVQFQESNFPTGLTVRRILQFFLEKTRKPNLKLIEELIENLEIDEFIDVDSSRVSGGQAQKLNVVLALTNSPSVLVLDELTTGLDVFAKKKVTDAIEKYMANKAHGNVTLLLVSHSPVEIERLTTRVVTIEKGNLVSDMSVKDIVKKYKSVAEYLDHLAEHG